MIIPTPLNTPSPRLASANEQLLKLRSERQQQTACGNKLSQRNSDFRPKDYPTPADLIAATLTPKQKRQLCRLYTGDRPDQALRQLNKETDPLIRFLTKLFQAGYAAVQQVRFSDLHLAVFIDDILKGNHVPDATHVIRPDISDCSPFQRKEDDLIDFSPGTGQFPPPPPHTCSVDSEESRRGAVLTISPIGTTITPLINAQWRETPTSPICQACLHKRALRLSQQLLTMSQRYQLVWAEMGEADFKRFTARIRQKRHRRKEQIAYCAYPQMNGRYVVICEPAHIPVSIEAQTIPLEKELLYELMGVWVQTPTNKRISSSANWGEHWQGTRGDGRVKQAKKTQQPVAVVVQVRTSATVREAAKLLGDLISRRTVRYGFFYTRRNPHEVCRKLAESGYELALLNGASAGLDAVLRALKSGGVTDKAQKDDLNHLCELSVTEPAAQVMGRPRSKATTPVRTQR